MALAGYKAIVKSQSSAVALVAEATSTSDNQVYQITDSNKRILDFATAVVIDDGGSPTAENYTINRLDGLITFESVDAGRVITVDGAYVVLTQVAQAKSYNFNGVTDMGDTTVFQKQYREFKPLLSSATITLGKFYSVDNYFLDLLKSKEVFVVEIKPDDSGTFVMRVYATVASDGVSSTVEGLIEEGISLQATDEMIMEA